MRPKLPANVTLVVEARRLREVSLPTVVEVLVPVLDPVFVPVETVVAVLGAVAVAVAVTVVVLVTCVVCVSVWVWVWMLVVGTVTTAVAVWDPGSVAVTIAVVVVVTTLVTVFVATNVPTPTVVFVWVATSVMVRGVVSGGGITLGLPEGVLLPQAWPRRAARPMARIDNLGYCCFTSALRTAANVFPPSLARQTSGMPSDVFPPRIGRDLGRLLHGVPRLSGLGKQAEKVLRSCPEKAGGADTSSLKVEVTI
jgi:hypothetical protein